MANVSHALLTGSNLHEPKGVSSAAVGTVYVADGAGSGNWTLASTLLSVAAWSTGDVKPTFKTTVDDGWVFMDDGSIGSASSAATTRANADCENLFKLIWNGVSNTYAPVSGGRGASAANDWAANKRITLPRALGRALGAAGAGSGLTSRSLGAWLGNELETLSTAQLPAHHHTINTSGNTVQGGVDHSHTFGAETSTESSTHTHQSVVAANQNQTIISAGSGTSISSWGGGSTNQVTGTQSTTHVHSVSGTTGAASSYLHTHGFVVNAQSTETGSGIGHLNVQPTLFINWMVKL